MSGEGGMLAINDAQFINRAEVIWEKGTNRAAFFRGEINKYGWIDTGSSFLPSEITAAFLWAQIENMNDIQEKRIEIWNNYYFHLKEWAEKVHIELMNIPAEATNNAHMFYLVCKNATQRTELITHLKNKGILAVFHYLSLHSSTYYKDKHDGRALPNSDKFTERLVRLPMYYELNVALVVDKLTKF
jgi:dTDP-4-amino-4,6-dideoxygalactose transaminase